MTGPRFPRGRCWAEVRSWKGERSAHFNLVPAAAGMIQRQEAKQVCGSSSHRLGRSCPAGEWPISPACVTLLPAESATRGVTAAPGGAPGRSGLQPFCSCTEPPEKVLPVLTTGVGKLEYQNSGLWMVRNGYSRTTLDRQVGWELILKVERYGVGPCELLAATGTIGP